MAKSFDKAYMTEVANAQRDEQIASAEAYYQTDAGLADKARVYADEIAAEKAVAATIAKLPAGWIESLDDDTQTAAEIAEAAGVTEEEVEAAYFADEPQHKHLWNVAPRKHHWE